MSITASRLGKSPIVIDWTNLNTYSNDPLSYKDGTKAFEPSEFKKAWASLLLKFEKREVGFFDTPNDPTLSHLDECLEVAASVKNQGFTDCLFLGIGGSSLGPISLLSALSHKTSSAMKFHFLENPDPVEFNQTMKLLSPARTLVCIVTKSGTTFETLALFRVALEWLGKSRWQSHIIGITDPKKGDIREFCNAEGIKTLAIDPSIGGRFSIFSPVGLLPIILSGLKAELFLEGAKLVTDFVKSTPEEKNPLFILGADLLKKYPDKHIHVFMPYTSTLKQVGAWFVQMWSESLGKDKKGFTPLSCVGATDQHSILQLLRDGPNNKVTWFVSVDNMGEDIKIPKSTPGYFKANYPAFQLLEGHTLSRLLDTEYQATSKVLTKQGRPNLTIRLDSLDERSLGALYMALSTLTAFTGALWGINPFDQPGVEEGKVYIRDSLNEQRHSAIQKAQDAENSPVTRLRSHD